MASHMVRFALDKRSLFHQSHLPELQHWQKGGSWGQNPPEDSSSKNSSTSLFFIILAISCADSCGGGGSFSGSTQPTSTPLQCWRALLPGGQTFRDTGGVWGGFSLHHELTVQTTQTEDSGRPRLASKMLSDCLAKGTFCVFQSLTCAALKSKREANFKNKAFKMEQYCR